MRTLTFYGASDDLFECDDSARRDTEEIGCYRGPAMYRVQDGDAGLLVVGLYAPNNVVGCWSVGISQLDEDKPLPDWPMVFKAEGYSVRLVITVPDSAKCKPVLDGNDEG